MQNELPSQSLKAKGAEIQFRPFIGERAALDPVFGEMYRERALETYHDLEALEKYDLAFGPFLEIGAGSGHRSAVLVNHCEVDGVAIDISQGSLENAPYVLSLLGFDRAPLRICCDAHHLPFLDDTFQFVFAYRTLHHFGNPVPATAECYRVLGQGGHFFFNGEPMIGPVIRVLRGRRLLSDPPSSWQRWASRYRLEKVFWDDGDRERSLGIVEARYDLNLWRQALRPFEVVDIEVSRRLKIHSDLEKPALNVFLAGLIGGNVKGLCMKKSGAPVQGNVLERLMCLDCRSYRLAREKYAGVICANCGRIYPVRAGVIRMLPKALESDLYPSKS